MAESLNAPPSSPRRIFLFDCPRTASHLFMKIFSEHSELKLMYFPFLLAYVSGPQKMAIPAEDADPEMMTTMSTLGSDITFEKAWLAVLDHVDSAEKEGKIPFFKEHTLDLIPPQLDPICTTRPQIAPPLLKYSAPDVPTPTPNPTYIPTAFLLTMSPVFLIRHPARVIPSLIKAAEMKESSRILSDTFKSSSSYRWSRLIFDWYREYYGNKGPWPAVVDADDLIANPQVVSGKLCALLGIDPKGVILEWDQAEVPSNQPKFLTAYLGSLQKSNGIIKNKEAEKESITIDREKTKWEDTYGAEVATAMAAVAQGLMEDYEYLLQFRIQA